MSDEQPKNESTKSMDVSNDEEEDDFIEFIPGKLAAIEGDAPLTADKIPRDAVNVIISGTVDMMDAEENPAKANKNGSVLSAGVFPDTLKSLTITNYPLKAPFGKGVLPAGLKKLDWGCNVELLHGSLPEGLVHLTVGGSFNLPLAKDVLPKSLRVLEIFNYGYNQRLAPGVLPEGLKQLMLPEMFRHALEPGVIPSSLEVLVMDCKYYNFPFKKGIFPADSKLTNFIMRINVRHFNQPFGVGSLPDGLVNLDLTGTETFDQPFRKGVLPRDLKVLRLGRAWTQPLTASMFESCKDLEVLSLDEVEEWDHPIKAGVLPPNLRGLHLPMSFSHKLKASVLPSKLEYLSIPDANLIEGKLPEGCKVSAGEDDDDEDSEDDFEDEDED